MMRHEIVDVMARRLAGTAKDPVPTGAHAALRRLNPEHPGAAVAIAYGFLADCGLELEQSASLDRWVLLAHVLALARGRHQRNVPIGRGLRSLDYREARLKQLLNADYPLLRELLPRLARRMDAAGESFDLGELVELIFAAGRDEQRLERARLAIARSFVVAQRQDSKRNAT